MKLNDHSLLLPAIKMTPVITEKPSLIHEGDDLKDTQKAEAFLADAQAGNDSEVKMGLIAALRLYPKASAWSIAISFAVVMEGESDDAGSEKRKAYRRPFQRLVSIRLRYYPHQQFLRLSGFQKQIRSTRT